LRDLGGEKRVVREQSNDIMKKLNMLRVLVATISMAAFVLGPWPAHGQAASVNPAEAKESSGTQSATAPREEHLKVEHDVVFFRLPGKPWNNGQNPATVGNAVKALRALYPDATFAVDPHVAELPLTDLIVRANEPTTDLWALRTACGDGFDIGSEEPNSLYMLQRNKMTDVDPSKKEDRDIECFSLNGYLDWRFKDQETKHEQQEEEAAKAVDQLQAIILQTIGGFDGDIKMPQFQFYRQAQLLIVTGSNRAIAIAAKVIYALPGQRNPFGSVWNARNSFDRQPNFREIQPDNAFGPAAKMGGALPATSTLPNSTYNPNSATNK
jgi:hypothetical protein